MKTKPITRIWNSEDEEKVPCPRCKSKMRRTEDGRYKCYRCSFGRAGN
jgi:ribosomal protein L37AE/L43A